MFSGIANGPSRVTLTQNGRMLYSGMMPSGPFSVTDVPLYSSGDVTMTVTGDDGREQTQVFPLSVMAGQLSPGQHEFSVAAGIPDDDSDLEGGVFAASYGYGLDGLTLRTGGVFNATGRVPVPVRFWGWGIWGRSPLTALMPRRSTGTAAAAGIR